MTQNLLRFFVVMFFAIGILFFVGGITGMAVVDINPPYCYSDDPCSVEEVCCRFYEKEYGSCATLDKCDYVYELTRKHDVSNINQRDNFQLIVVGAFSLLLGTFGYLHDRKINKKWSVVLVDGKRKAKCVGSGNVKEWSEKREREKLKLFSFFISSV